MNFLPGSVADGAVQTALGTIPLTDRLRGALEAEDAPRELVLGIRPEHFEDAALVDETTRRGGVEFSGQVEVLESMGSDKYAFFSLSGDRVRTQELEELAADVGTADLPSRGTQLTTRLSAASAAAEGAHVEVWFDPDRMHLFDPGSGRNIGQRD
jgi:multiple sugar transport system ATP-binding protein